MADDAPRFLLGSGDGWHAVDLSDAQLRCDDHWWSLCRHPVILAEDDAGHQVPWNPDGYPAAWDPCPDCRWLSAAATGADYSTTLASLSHPLASRVAVAILEAQVREQGDTDSPAMLQRLAAVSRHMPVPLVDEACSEGDCEHQGDDCPSSLACPACSLQAGPWAGEWEGQYELVIGAPCAVLLALAEEAGVRA